MKYVPSIRSLLRTIATGMPHAVFGAVLLYYAWVQIGSFVAAYPEWDPDGYVVPAKRIARGQSPAMADEEFRHQGHLWVQNRRGQVLPKFGPGFPGLLAAGYVLFGDEGIYYVNPVLGAAALLGALLLFRLWMSPWAAALATVTLATTHMYMFFWGYLLPHAANTCFLIWGMHFLWRWKRFPGVGAGVGAGLTLGYAVLIRATSAIFAPLVLVAVAAVVIEGRKAGRRRLRAILALLGAYAVFPALLMAYNWALFGGPLTTGYALSGEQGAFSVASFLDNVRTINRDLVGEALFLILSVGLAGALVAGPWADRLMRVGWLLPWYFLHAGYYWIAWGRGYLRFYMAIIPVLVGSAYLLMDSGKFSRAGKNVGMTAACLLILAAGYESLKETIACSIYGIPARQQTVAGRLLARTLRPDAALFGQGMMAHSPGMRKDFLFYDLDAFSKGRGRSFLPWTRTHTPQWYYRHHQVKVEVRGQLERMARLKRFYDGTSDKQLLEKLRELIREQLRRGRQVAFFLPDRAMAGRRDELGKGFQDVKLAGVRIFDRPHGIYEIHLRHEDLVKRAAPLRKALTSISLRTARGRRPPEHLAVAVDNPFDAPLTGAVRWRRRGRSPWSPTDEAMKIDVAAGGRQELRLPIPRVVSGAVGSLQPGPMGTWSLKVGDRVLWAALETPIRVDPWPHDPARSTMRDCVGSGIKAVDAAVQGPTKLELKLVNPTKLSAVYRLSWPAIDRCRWRATPAAAEVRLPPGGEAAQSFSLSLEGEPHQLFPPPQLAATIEVGGQVILRTKAPAPLKVTDLWRKARWAVECPRATGPPALDGRLDDEVWKAAAVLRDFVVAHRYARADFPTEVRLAYDDRNLYAAFRCTEPKLDGLVAWVRYGGHLARNRDDSVELFFDVPLERKDFFQYTISATGVVARRVGHDAPWRGPCTVKVGRESGAWTVEMAIPWGSLQMDAPAPGRRIGVEFARHRAQDPPEHSRWAGTAGGNYRAERFGTLTFK